VSRFLYFIENQKIKNNKCQTRDLVIDARIKPHHAPVLEKDAGIEKKIDKLFSKGGELYEYFKKKGR
jgi:4-hydroxy-3-polyprenylbenzoate decarboxylase